MPPVTWGAILTFAIAMVLLYALGKILALPMRVVGKLILNGIVGGVLLILINLVGKYVGLTIGINPITALVSGFLGLPGVAMLVLLRLILMF